MIRSSEMSHAQMLKKKIVLENAADPALGSIWLKKVLGVTGIFAKPCQLIRYLGFILPSS